jgi:hypothetical protein
MNRREGVNWHGDFGPDLTSHAPAHLTAMLWVRSRDMKTLRRFVEDIAVAPDLKVDYTEGRGWRWRNVRIRVTGPTFAVRVASTQLRDLVGATGPQQ